MYPCIYLPQTTYLHVNCKVFLNSQIAPGTTEPELHKNSNVEPRYWKPEVSPESRSVLHLRAIAAPRDGETVQFNQLELRGRRCSGSFWCEIHTHSLPILPPFSIYIFPSHSQPSHSKSHPLSVSLSQPSSTTSHLQGLRDLDIYLYSGKAQHIVQYLRQCLKNSKPYYRLKLFVVGLEGRGKTSLVGSIIKKSEKNPSNLATVGVEKHDWFYKGKDQVNNQSELVIQVLSRSVN